MDEILYRILQGHRLKGFHGGKKNIYTRGSYFLRELEKLINEKKMYRATSKLKKNIYICKIKYKIKKKTTS